MTKRSLWRLLFTLAVCAACAYFFVPLKKVHLGLDLKGGVHFELEVQGQEALEADLRDTRDRIVDRMQEQQIPGQAILEAQDLRVDGIPAEQRAAFEKMVKDKVRGYTVAFGADGAAKLLQTAEQQHYLKDEANKRALQIIENRINQFGVAEPEVTQSGAEGNRIVVELPGVEEGDRERIKSLLSTPGRLEQRLLAKSDQIFFPTKEAALAHFNGTIPPQFEVLPDIEQPHGAPKVNYPPGKEPIVRWVLLESKVGMDGADIIDAHRSQSEVGSNTVAFALNKKGADDFANMTGVASSERRAMGIVLDRKVISVLTAEKKIIGGAVEISGSFTPQEADDLALKLKSGALKASMRVMEEGAVGASLGGDQIKSGVLAAAVSFGVIVAFMVFWYHWSGVNAIVALTVNVIVMLGLLGSFRATLTLPGIAGFALTIGMAVDANILIFERIKEELAAGRSVARSVDAGFDKVFWTIVDSHVTQLVAALLLFGFGTGPVKGFAVTLAVGVIASLFTSIYISRFIYDWILERHPNAKTLSVGGHSFFKDPKFDFMKYKGIALALSWGLIVACVLVARPWKLHDNSHIKLGMQFVGGNDMTVRILGDTEVQSVRAALAQGGFPDASVVARETSNKAVKEFAIKVKARENADAKDATKLVDQIVGTLKTLDPSDKPALNLEGTNTLQAHLTQVNPLHVSGDEEAFKAAYEPLASKVTSARVRLPLGLFQNMSELPQDLPAAVRQTVESDYRVGRIGILKSESFSPSISGEWTNKTLTAVGLALAAILIYVVLRFTWSFSIGGIVALVHDVLMALGLFALFGFEFNVPVVASFLTLIGYSMADTIVVFDRIRENSHKPEYRRASVTQLINDSINQTLSRTILTSASVLFVSICLFAFGGPALRDLSFPLVVGVITGTYSSIYIASPVVVYWDQWFGGKDKLKQHA